MEPGSLESDSRLRPVNADDLKRVWGLIRKITDHGAGGIGGNMVAQQCGPGADWNAVFFRAALLHHLFESGMLNDWRKGNEPAALVFQVGAVFPIEPGGQGFELADFIERLRSEEP